MSTTPSFRIESVEYKSALPDLRSVRDIVFVQEQNVPLEIELDELDPQCRHVLARDADGRAIGTGRLTPAHAIGRMAVLADWRGRGVGDALLLALVEEARRLGWRDVSLHAQVPAIGFYSRHGFVPYEGRFIEAGIEHQAMRRMLDKPNPVETRHGALAAVLGVIAGARRSLLIYSRDLDPGLLDASEVLAAMRRFATEHGETRVLVQDPGTPQRALAPLIGLAQRLPSAFAFRAVEEPGDRLYPSAFVVNDRGGWYFRTLGHRFDGETELNGEARARQMRSTFEPMWERARPCTEFRALGI